LTPHPRSLSAVSSALSQSRKCNGALHRIRELDGAMRDDSEVRKKMA